ncbi:YiiD C-terminal domain-containing protein [Nocardioides sp. YIM 152588]|uniref:PaaI family thioesterase n=1 Tax=Nocardioides sp. YIM 152588 TaxID=3158259 RepID=UPI0032E3D1A8
MTEHETSPLPSPADLTAYTHRVIPILGAMGIEVIEAGRNDVAARLPFGPNGNHFGSAYAGSLFTVAEVLGGIYASTSLVLEGAVPLVKRLEIDYRRPANSDVVSRATLPDEEIERILAETAANGKSDFQLSAELTDESGTVVATTLGHYQMRKF